MAEQRLVSSRIPQIELLRVMATAGVFLYHLWTVIPLTPHAMLLGPIFERLPILGTLGVIIFNGVTGFVLSVSYLSPDNPRPIPGIWDFFRSRFGRVCQQYYPTLILWTLVGSVSGTLERGWSTLGVALVTHLVFLHTLNANTFFAIVPAFWWLGMLAQFYLVYPLLLRLFKRLAAGQACALICLVSWSTWAVLMLLARQFPGSTWALVQYMAYFNLPVRLPEFALGMWLAAAWNRAAPLLQTAQPTTTAPGCMTQRAAPLLVGILLFLLLRDAWLQQLFPLFGHLYLVGWCIVVALAVLRWSLAVELGSTRWLLDLAAASYGIYLLHQPLLSYANDFLASTLSPEVRFAVLLVGVGCLCYKAAVLLNLLLYRLFR